MANYPATYNFNLIKGSSWNVVLTLVDDDENPLNLTSSRFEAQIRDETAQTEYGQIDVRISDALGGKLELSMDYLLTSELDPKIYYFYDLVRIQANTDENEGSSGGPDTREFVMRGMITVVPSYTPG